MNITEGNMRGLGNDIIEISRIRQSIEQHGDHFYSKLFTAREQEYCLKQNDPAPSFAVRFAAKESIAKALGCGFGKDLSWHDLEIINDERGKPSVICSEGLNSRFSNPHFLISLSHCREYATAVAVYL